MIKSLIAITSASAVHIASHVRELISALQRDNDANNEFGTNDRGKTNFYSLHTLRFLT